MSQQAPCPPSIGPSPPPNRPPEDIGTDELMKAAGWDTIPLFMKDLPKELNQADPNAPVNHTIEALQALIYDEDEDEKLRSLEALKARANELFGCRDYRQALGFYKQAVEILEKPAPADTTHSEPESTAATNIPQELRNSIYSNRAACHLSLGNFRSCLTDCATVLSPPLPVPATKLVRKCFFRSAKALASLERFDEALDCLNKLMAIDQRDRLTNDDEPKKLKGDIERQIAHRQAEKQAKETAEEGRKVLEKALKDALQSRGILIPTHCPFPPPESSLPSGFEPVHFEEIPTDVEPAKLVESIKEIPLIYPVYVLRPKDEYPTRDLVLRWHEDDLMSAHLEALCGGTDSHHLYLITSKRRILKCGNNLTIRKILNSLSKNQSGDCLCLGDQGNLEFFLLPIGDLEKEWIEITKRNFSQAS
ncbi:uncharacterized protein PGTG_00484 [Puccinia graminis f. sp. tritici CRL 75-36-700-3]|uniref:Cns1/TTC4 wheel domain-containing protein n=1 Tax=Puccinia graminis f. sp. tritici (strain CRL 75-36-700-3 / race SCCL) TaxID=418459 RepID=E3JRA6_PUCGT|nr:uncharacterized protein PGTG_00484 [Puccinia graminis f. sp. tritici CRL 75-36-700-3]EFP74528.1 hypothetical protein PGTG_00484 [Puccinia graminis f. sp. tritici CRL 75-36-700-3]